MVVDISENKLILIGEIDFSGCDDELINESSIVSKDNAKPNIRGIGKCEVFIGSDEGPVPHIHIKSNDTTWGSCICLHEAYYFPHGGNPMTEGVFNSKQAKEFDDWMGKPNMKRNTRSNYLQCASVWLDQYGSKYAYIYEKNNTNFSVKPNYRNMIGDFNENLR